MIARAIIRGVSVSAPPSPRLLDAIGAVLPPPEPARDSAPADTPTETPEITVSPLQRAVLLALHDAPRPMPVAQIAQQVQRPANSAWSLLSALHRAGLVQPGPPMPLGRGGAPLRVWRLTPAGRHWVVTRGAQSPMDAAALRRIVATINAGPNTGKGAWWLGCPCSDGPAPRASRPATATAVCVAMGTANPSRADTDMIRTRLDAMVARRDLVTATAHRGTARVALYWIPEAP